MERESRWTLQQFSTIAGQPWFALQEQNDGGVECQFTGYRYGMEVLADVLGIVPDELSPMTEDEFFSRILGVAVEIGASGA